MKKTTKIVLLIISVLFVLQGLTFFGISLYRSSMTLYTYPDDFKHPTGDSIRNGKFLDLDSTNFHTIIFHGLNNDSIHANNGSINNIDVYVTKSNSVGFGRFIPIFKSIKFSSKISYHWTVPLNKSTQILISDSGSLDIQGRSNILGICSGKIAEQLVLNSITGEAQRMIKEDIKGLLMIKRIN